MLRLGLAAVVFAVATLLPSSAAHGASACATAVLRDWSEDGRVAPKYSLPCYEDAIEALPADLRDYTNAEDEITRALSSAVRTKASVRSVDESGQGEAPLALVAIAGTAVSVLLAGGVGFVVRRARAD